MEKDTSRKSFLRALTAFLLWAAISLLSMRLFAFVDEYAVNVPYWDQWDFLTPFFEGAGLWDRIRWQHGPHRQGLGAILLSVVYPLTDWNIRYECFVSACLLVLTCMVYLWTQKRLWGRWRITDLVIPLIFLSLLQSELFTGAPNPSHGPLPALLIALIAITLTIKNALLRCWVLGALSIVSTYTGFGFFNGLILPLWLLWETLTLHQSGASGRQIYSAFAATCVATFGTASFFWGYQDQPAIACFEFPHRNPFEYIKFAALMVGRTWGSTSSAVLEGRNPEKTALVILEFAALLGVWGYSCRRVISRRQIPGDKVILYLSSFTLIFVCFTAIGRVCGGMIFTLSSRYLPYTNPGVLATYLSLILWLQPSILKKGLLTILLCLLIYKESHFNAANAEFINMRDGKVSWIQCFMSVKDITRCNGETGFKMRPSDDPKVLSDKFRYLEKNGLSFFKYK